MNSTPLGYRIVGPCSGERKMIDWQRAFAAFAECDARARVEAEGYLSAFTFGDDFRAHLCKTGSTRGFAGPCGAPWLWFDIDRPPDAGGVDAALQDARRLAVALSDRFGVDDTAQLWAFSGAKGFHAGIPTVLWMPTPSTDFHRITRRMAETIADAAGVVIDTGVYDKVRAFRAPNSRHPKTGHHKCQLTVDELMHLRIEAIIERAATPQPFELPDMPTESTDFLVAYWDTATRQVREQAEATAQGGAVAGATLNRQTRDFISQGAAQGDRHRLLYSASANLGELGATYDLAYALLAESALDSGLPPQEVERQIRCGLADSAPGGGA